MLGSVAILGNPSEKSNIGEYVPPSVVVGGTMSKSNSPLTTGSASDSRTPFILVYGLSANTMSIEESNKPSEDFYSSTGSTGNDND